MFMLCIFDAPIITCLCTHQMYSVADCSHVIYAAFISKFAKMAIGLLINLLI